MDSHHWRIDGANDFPRIFLALVDLLSPGSVIGFCGGSLSPEVRSFFTQNSLTLDPAVTESLPMPEFVDAHFLPVDRSCMADLAAIAEHHAEPEIALFMVAISDGSSVLEWYDAPGGSISISAKFPEEEISAFARTVGGVCVADAALRPSPWRYVMSMFSFFKSSRPRLEWIGEVHDGLFTRREIQFDADKKEVRVTIYRPEGGRRQRRGKSRHDVRWEGLVILVRGAEAIDLAASEEHDHYELATIRIEPGQVHFVTHYALEFSVRCSDPQVSLLPERLSSRTWQEIVGSKRVTSEKQGK